MRDIFPDNFIIVDAPKFFSDIYYRTDVLSKVNIDIQLKPLIPVNFDNWEISTTLHGGLGNNLFQMNSISFISRIVLTSKETRISSFSPVGGAGGKFGLYSSSSKVTNRQRYSSEPSSQSLFWSHLDFKLMQVPLLLQVNSVSGLH